ncbi:hypothetical protein H4R21_006635 [Coemansia helicoidea]|nr:hypothetical protein H4R21_006635 [Coemansia helicoidea]
MFAPAAKAIGRPDVAEEIRDDDYRVTLKGLECLSSSLAKFPDIRSKCAAPTAANLRTIYDALAAVLSRF